VKSNADCSMSFTCKSKVKEAYSCLLSSILQISVTDAHLYIPAKDIEASMVRAIPLSLEEYDKSFRWWEVGRAVQTIDAINETLPDSACFKFLRTDHCKVIYVPYYLGDRSDLRRSMFAFAHMNKSRENRGLGGLDVEID